MERIDSSFTVIYSYKYGKCEIGTNVQSAKQKKKLCQDENNFVISY